MSLLPKILSNFLFQVLLEELVPQSRLGLLRQQILEELRLVSDCSLHNHHHITLKREPLQRCFLGRSSFISTLIINYLR